MTSDPLTTTLLGRSVTLTRTRNAYPCWRSADGVVYVGQESPPWFVASLSIAAIYRTAIGASPEDALGQLARDLNPLEAWIDGR